MKRNNVERYDGYDDDLNDGPSSLSRAVEFVLVRILFLVICLVICLSVHWECIIGSEIRGT